MNSKGLVKGLALVALDNDFATGAGPEVRGSLLDLVMAMAGRREACPGSRATEPPPSPPASGRAPQRNTAWSGVAPVEKRRLLHGNERRSQRVLQLSCIQQPAGLVRKIQHLLVVAQLEAVQAGEREGLSEQPNRSKSLSNNGYALR